LTAWIRALPGTPNGILIAVDSENPGEEYGMSTKPSEQMMDLLKELAMLKALDERHETGSESGADTAELESRKNRRREIGEQIRTLGGLLG
jgi:hypothetical protein